LLNKACQTANTNLSRCGNIFANHDNCGCKYGPLCIYCYTLQHFKLTHPCVAEFACLVAAVAAEVLTSRLQRSKGAEKERVALMVDTYLPALSTCLLRLSAHPHCDVSAFLFCVWPLHHMATLRTSTTLRKSSFHLRDHHSPLWHHVYAVPQSRRVAQTRQSCLTLV
jgi:hypothetical protein